MSYTVPQYEQPMLVGKQLSSVWYRFFQALWAGQQPSNEISVTLGASPYAFTAPQRGFVILKGGTVSAVQFTRSVTTLTGLTAGIFPMNQNDVLTVTYTVLPTFVFVPI